MFPPPEAIAALSAYDRAIEGQPTSTQEAIVKRIIELAAVGSATLGSCARARLLCMRALDRALNRLTQRAAAAELRRPSCFTFLTTKP